MKNKKILVVLFVVFLLLAATTTPTLLYKHEVNREINSFEIEKVRIFMSQKEVEALHGIGPDETPGCFGCGMNFIYPELKLSGRYSETLDRTRKNGGIDHRKSPKVKQLTTANESIVILGVRIGDTFKKAKRELESRGYRLMSVKEDRYFNYYYKNNMFIRLWVDEEIDHFRKQSSYLGNDNEIVRSISIEVRIEKDEEINY